MISKSFPEKCNFLFMSTDEFVTLWLASNLFFFSNTSTVKDADAGRGKCRDIPGLGWKPVPNMDSESRS
jgi:hypothetical protein